MKEFTILKRYTIFCIVLPIANKILFNVNWQEDFRALLSVFIFSLLYYLGEKIKTAVLKPNKSLNLDQGALRITLDNVVHVNQESFTAILTVNE